jgi:HlyD family secretion protein
MKASKLKWLLAFGVIVALCAVGGFSYLNRTKKIEYMTARLDRGDINAVVSATGNCNAVVSVQVGSQVSGNILELRADYNTKVKMNQLVAVIDPAPFQARVDQAKANVDNARASVLNAQSQMKKTDADVASATAAIANQKANVIRAKSAVSDAKNKLDRRIEMFEKKVVSREDRDTAQATYDQALASLEAAEAQVTAALSSLDSTKAQREVVQSQFISAQSQVKQQEANLQQAQLDLDHTQIRAPVDGTVIARNMDVGQTVAASFSAPTIFQIAQDLTKMQVDTNIDESDISRVQIGQEATFTVDAYPGQTFRGEVYQIRHAPINVQNVITYDVVVRVDNPDLKLFPGMTANVRILTQKATDVLRLPSAALRVRLDAGNQAKKGGKGAPGQDGQNRGGEFARGGGNRGGGGGGRGKGGGFNPNPGAGAARAALAQLQTVYVLGEDGKPRAERVRLGIGDGGFNEVLSNNLKEGDTIITGILSGGPAATPGFPGQQQNKNNFKGRGFF